MNKPILKPSTGKLIKETLAKYDKFCNNPRHGWINVKDRLPETNVRLLLAYEIEIRDKKMRNYTIGYLSLDGSFYYDETYWRNVRITHWMPLPELPEKD